MWPHVAARGLGNGFHSGWHVLSCNNGILLSKKTIHMERQPTLSLWSETSPIQLSSPTSSPGLGPPLSRRTMQGTAAVDLGVHP